MFLCHQLAIVTRLGRQTLVVAPSHIGYIAWGKHVCLSNRSIRWFDYWLLRLYQYLLPFYNGLQVLAIGLRRSRCLFPPLSCSKKYSIHAVPVFVSGITVYLPMCIIFHVFSLKLLPIYLLKYPTWSFINHLRYSRASSPPSGRFSITITTCLHWPNQSSIYTVISSLIHFLTAALAAFLCGTLSNALLKSRCILLFRAVFCISDNLKEIYKINGTWSSQHRPCWVRLIRFFASRCSNIASFVIDARTSHGILVRESGL